jgi:hypothetical protein
VNIEPAYNNCGEIFEENKEDEFLGKSDEII